MDRQVLDVTKYDTLVQRHIDELSKRSEWGDRQSVEEMVAQGMCPGCQRMGGWHHAWCQLIIAIRGNAGWINTGPLTQAEIDRFNG